MSKAANNDSEKWDQYRDADLSRETVEPEPEAVLVYACPLDGCDTTSDTEQGFRNHVTRSDHDTSLIRASMECAYCGDTFEVQYSNMDSAYCSPDCAYEDGRDATPTVVDPPLEPDVSSTVRYPCPVDDCETVAKSERGLRRHATQSHNGMGRITRDCEECGQTFHERASVEDTTKYCSKECLFESRRAERIELDCEQCGDTFDVYPNRADVARYCSYECSRLGKMKPRVAMACSWCSEEIERIEREQFDDRFCDKECLIEWLLEYHETMPTPNIAEYEPEELGLAPFSESAPQEKLPYAPPLLDVEVGRETCLQWRERVLEAGSLEVVADGALVPVSVVEEHVTGVCEHGFDASVMPLRYNGIEWTSTAVETGERSRRGATFDG